MVMFRNPERLNPFIFPSLQNLNLLCDEVRYPGDFTLLFKGRAKRERVEGKVVWITGASRGIGEVLAGQFASLGAKLILSARNVAELERVKIETIGKYPGANIEILPLDLASGEEALKDAVKKAESLFSASGVDYMVHNAAFECPERKAPDETEEGIQRRVSSKRCAELTIVAATHDLKEAWISYQPVLLVMYLVQYMPTIGFWFMDKIGGNRLEAAKGSGETYGWKLFFGEKKKTA